MSPDERALAERVAQKASRVYARFWLAEMSKLEEATLDATARWDLLKRAMSQTGDGG